MWTLIHKRKIDIHSWKLVFKRGINSRDGSDLKLSSRQLPNSRTIINSIQSDCYRSVQQETLLYQNLHNLILGKVIFNPSRNFSTTRVVGSIFSSGNRRTQDKEKLQNYIFFGSLAFLVLVVAYLSLTLETHQDYIYVETEEPKNKK